MSDTHGLTSHKPMYHRLLHCSTPFIPVDVESNFTHQGSIRYPSLIPFEINLSVVMEITVATGAGNKSWGMHYVIFQVQIEGQPATNSLTCNVQTTSSVSRS